MGDLDDVRHLNAGTVLAAVSSLEAVNILREALRAGLDPADDPPRGVVDLRYGQALIMPTEFGDRAGVKLAMVAPGNPEQGLPRIQGIYVLMDARTFVPLVTMDGPALTALRTPAVTVAALEAPLRASSAPVRIAIVGQGPQARGHAQALTEFLADVRPVASLTHLTRGDVDDRSLSTARLGTGAGDAVLAEADLVVCATTATEPVFDSALLRDDVLVAAVGSHEAHKRELDSALLKRAQVVVEDRATALREAGDVVLALAEGALVEDDLVTMADVVRRPEVLEPGRPVVFKGTGMAWQDVVIADAVHRRAGTR